MHIFVQSNGTRSAADLVGRCESRQQLCLAMFVAMLILWSNVISVAHAQEQGAGSDAPMAAPQRVGGTLLEMFNKADLRVQWDLVLPLGRASQLKSIFYHDGRLYALNDRNVLTALDGSEGTIAWSALLGQPKSACFPPYYYEGSILFVLGNTVVEIRETDGKKLQQLELDFAVSTSAACLNDRLFLGSTNKRFYCLRRTDGVPLWQSVCPAEPTGTVAVKNNKVYFVCQDGALYVSGTGERSLVWQAQTAGSVPGAVIEGQQCYLPSADTCLYCFAADTGVLSWSRPYLAGGKLVELPVLTGSAVYQPVESKSLLCLNRNDASLRWELKDGYCLLAENGWVSYAMTLDKELTLMNNNSGQRIVSFYVQNMDLYARNNEDAFIFLANRRGNILALKPDKIEQPASVPSASVAAETPP